MAYYVSGIGMVCDVQLEQAAEYVVVVPAAKFIVTDTIHAITSLVRLTQNAGSARAPGAADPLAYAAGAALSDATRRRVHAAIQAALRTSQRITER